MPKITIKFHKELAQKWQFPQRIDSLGVLGCPSARNSGTGKPEEQKCCEAKCHAFQAKFWSVFVNYALQFSPQLANFYKKILKSQLFLHQQNLPPKFSIV
ncbi:MAG: hypothetical protein J5676_11455 [Bacteroidaceae bacterium]|nr:hypothetical protein [Bacteroidaceae bacterium]